MEWALVNGQRVKAEKSGAIGVCPGCGGEVRAKCGEIVSWHWAHINADCDPWSEPETDWHRKWKGYFPDTWQEVTKPPHRADVAGPDGVLEIQRSGISPAEIREREQFYGRMAWLLNGHDFWKNLEWIKVDGDYHRFRWKHARKTWIEAQRQIFIDTPFGLFRVKAIRDGSWKTISGSFVKAASLVKSLDVSGKTQASNGLHLYDAFTEEARKELIDLGRSLTDLHEKYAATESKAYGHWARPTPRWTGYLSVYSWILSKSEDQISEVIDLYEKQIKLNLEKIKRNQEIKVRQQLEMEQLKNKQQENERKWQARLAMQEASYTAMPVKTSSAGKKLPGKLDWSKINIAKPAWEDAK